MQTFTKIRQIQTLTKIRPVEAELFHPNIRTYRWTDRYDEPNNGFLQFCKRT